MGEALIIQKNINSNGKVFATINVTYPEGSTCTCSNDAKILIGTNTNGSVIFAIPYAGTWTVSCTDGNLSKNSTVSIITEGQSESIELTYSLILYRDGVFAAGYDAEKASQTGYASITKYDDCMQWYENGNTWDFFWITPAICPAGYSTLNITFRSDTTINIDNNTGRWGLYVSPADNFNSPNFAGYTRFTDFKGEKTLTYDVSGYTGTDVYYPTMYFGTSNTVFNGYITKIWLEP